MNQITNKDHEKLGISHENHKNHKNHRFRRENHKNNGNLIISCENQESHDNHRIPFENQETHENHRNQTANNKIIKVLKFQEENDKQGIPLPDEVEAVIRGHLTVYQKRWTFIPFAFMVMSTLLLLNNLLFHSTEVVATIVFTFFYYDFLSGVLHIVLDNPLNIGLPVLKEPCLEFQWHHHIPTVSIRDHFMSIND